MKKRLLTMALALCMILSLLPFGAAAADKSKLSLQYESNEGLVFFAPGGKEPTVSEENLLLQGDSADIPVGETVKLRLEQEKTIDWDQYHAGSIVFCDATPWYSDPGIFIRASYLQGNGEWFDGLVVDNNKVVKEGFTFKEHILTYKQPSSAMILYISWSKTDYIFNSFYGTEAKPIVIQCRWFGDDMQLPAGIPDTDKFVKPFCAASGGGWRAVFRVPADTKSVTFRWEDGTVLDGVRLIHEGESGFKPNPNPESTSYTLPIDPQKYTYYHVLFVFAWEPMENPFRDVKDSDYFFEPVLWALNHDPQITDGTSDTTFSPDATCTRGQIVTFLYRDMA